MFEQAFKNIDDVLWKEAGCTTELDYTEQTSWLLFLKYLDQLEEDKATEAKLDGKKYAFILDAPYRWESWAAPKGKDGQIDHNKAATGDDLRDSLWRCRLDGGAAKWLGRDIGALSPRDLRRARQGIQKRAWARRVFVHDGARLIVGSRVHEPVGEPRSLVTRHIVAADIGESADASLKAIAPRRAHLCFGARRLRPHLHHVVDALFVQVEQGRGDL